MLALESCSVLSRFVARCEMLSLPPRKGGKSEEVILVQFTYNIAPSSRRCDRVTGPDKQIWAKGRGEKLDVEGRK